MRKALKEAIGDERGGFFPVHLDIVRNGSALEFDAGDKDAYAALLESICGATDDRCAQWHGESGPLHFADCHVVWWRRPQALAVDPEGLRCREPQFRGR